MARNREKKGSLIFQLKSEFDKKLAIGQSKYEDKKNGLTTGKIYSWETYRTYLKHSSNFVKWCKKNYQVKNLEDCKNYILNYLEYRKNKGLSSYTLKLEVSALEKIFPIGIKEKFNTGDRNRVNIIRSRGKKVRDKHFSVENNKDLISFCRSTGLRRSELKALTGDKLRMIDNKPHILVNSATKGGRSRIIPVVNDVELVKKMMLNAGEGKVFEKIHNGADIHSYRADYCSSVYKLYRRKKIPKADKYICRKDKKGKVYDKHAMKIASQCLGHNRISVIAGHYLND